MKRLVASKLFLDGADPAETQVATQLLEAAGYVGLDGQTTNPSLVAKNPEIMKRVKERQKLSRQELLVKYKEIIEEIEHYVRGEISIEVYADAGTRAEDMIEQAHEFASWTDSAVIKLPITEQGLMAASRLKDEIRLNMTLCFSQQQAAAVYAATRGSAYPVYVSPFIGRLDDRGIDGMDLIANLLRMLEKGDGHMHVLTASVRSVQHVQEALRLGTQAITVNFEKTFEPWAQAGFPLASRDFEYISQGKAIEYEELDLDHPWQTYDIRHPLTDAGLDTFAQDWNTILQ